MYAIDQLRNLMREEAIKVLSTYSQTRIGKIVAYDPNTYTAKVSIQPEEIITNYLPILTPWVGNKWGFYVAPNLNDMVVVHFAEGDFSSGLIGQRLFNSTQQATDNTTTPPSGEAWIVHETGTCLKFHNDGTIEIKTLHNGTPTNININSNIVVTGNITVTGDILDNSSGAHTNTHTIRDMRTIYDSHVHPGVATGAGNTQITTQTM